MNPKIILIVFCAVLVINIEAKDFVDGTKVNNLLISTQKVVVKGYPLLRRDKDFVYVDPKLRIIKGIIARDLSRTKAEVTVTSGGVGATNVTLHLKSERGEGLNYLILIFGLNS